MENRWRVALVVILAVLVSALIMQWTHCSPGDVGDIVFEESSQLEQGNPIAYFPTWPGAVYEFAGEGMEFASFTRSFTFIAPGLAQVEDASGTNLAQIIEHTPDEVRIVWSKEEFYEEKNLLKDFSGADFELILIKTPFEVGTNWRDDRFKREIIAIGEQVTVPLGTFHDVLVIKSEALDLEGYVQYEYYGKNIGLIKRTALSNHGGEDYQVVSALEQLKIVR